MTTSAPAKTRDTFAVYHSMFLDYLRENKADNTVTTYGIAVQQLGDFLRSVGMPLNPTVLTGEHLREFMAYLSRPKPEGRGLGEAAKNQRFRSLSAFFKWLVNMDEIPESPMKKMPRPYVTKKLVPVISMDDLAKLMRTVDGTDYESRRDRAIISLFIDCGFRISEMVGMTLSTVDMLDREVTVLGKGRKYRKVRFAPKTRVDIQKYLLKRAGHRDAALDAFWLGKRGEMTKSGIYRMVVRRCEEAGIPKTWPHMLRHTFAHQYLSGGGSEGDLMRVTGWTSREMVDRYGASVASERAMEAHDRFSPRERLK